MIRSCLVAAVLSLCIIVGVLRAGGGLTMDGSTDKLNCGQPTWSASADSVSFIVFVRPGFASTATGSRYFVFSNFNGTTHDGWALSWLGDGSGDWRFSFGDGTGANAIVDWGSTVSFAAGDIIGFYLWDSNGLQHVELRNFSNAGTNTESGGNTFPLAVGTISQDLFLGGHATLLPWLGDILYFVSTNWRIFNTNVNQLPARRGFRYFPNWTIDVSAEGSATVDPVIAIDFALGNIGDVLSPGDSLVDRAGNSNDCAVITGASPVVTGRPMLLP